MKKFLFLVLLFPGCAVLSPLQKSRIISLYHLIETGKYTDAKEVAEELVEGAESSEWANTWFARGLLCQDAYTEGRKKNDAKLYELYPDQLYVAYDSYEKARKIESRERLDRQLAPKYVLLANEFQVIGEKEFQKGNFPGAFRAFEQALEIKQNPILTVQTDTLLIYNTALAAYESENWDKAVKYLTKLHDYRYSPNASHLLFEAFLKKGDKSAAKRTLADGIKFYNYDQTLVLLLADLHYNDYDPDSAIALLDEAISKQPLNPVFHYSKGLVFQKTGQFDLAIEAYEEAIRLFPDEVLAYVNIATCYYNIGVEIEETTRTISANSVVKKERARSAEAFEQAVSWLDKAYQKKPDDPLVVAKLYDLYKSLRQTEKAKNIESQINGSK